MPRKNNKKIDCGLYRVRIYIGKIDGIAKYKSVYGKTQAEANRKAEELRKHIREGYDVMHEDDNFSLWADRWLDNKRATVSELDYITYSGYRKRFSKLDDMQLNKIKQQDIQDIINEYAAYNEHTKKPTSKRTLKGYVKTIQQIFDLAIKNRVLQFNPADDIIIPTTAPVESRRALTKEEQQWILNTPHYMQRAAIIMMYSGLRRGELIPLVWSDIDFEEHTITVSKSVKLIGNRVVQKDGAKSKSGKRVIDIPGKLVEYLKQEYQSEKLKDNINVLVFPDPKNGEMINSERWRNLWDNYLITLNDKYGIHHTRTHKENGKKQRVSKITMLAIPNITAHWLRHTFCTMLYLSGVDVLTAKEQMGHSSVETTLKIYTHLDKQYKKKNISKLDEYLNKESV